MFTYNSEYMNDGVKIGGGVITKNGAYNLTIKKAKLLTSLKSKAEGIELSFETEEDERIKVNFFYKNKEGDSIVYGERLVNHLIFLGQIKNPTAFKREVLQSGSVEEVLTSFENVKIGVFIEYKGCEVEEANGKEYRKHKYLIHGFYDIKTKRTAKEVKENSQALEYEVAKKKLEEKWEKVKDTIEEVKEVKKNKNTKVEVENQSNETEEDFPF